MDEQKQNELNKVKNFYIKKANKIRRVTTQLMTKINNNETLADNIYTKELHKIKQIDATFELIDTLLQDLKQSVQYYDPNDPNDPNDPDNTKETKEETTTKKNNLLRSELDLLFPIMYSLYN